MFTSIRPGKALCSSTSPATERRRPELACRCSERMSHRRVVPSGTSFVAPSTWIRTEVGAGDIGVMDPGVGDGLPLHAPRTTAMPRAITARTRAKEYVVPAMGCIILTRSSSNVRAGSMVFMSRSERLGVGPTASSPWAFAGTDAVAIAAFVLTGAASHHDAPFLVILGRNLGPWAIAWVLAAAIFGAYRRPSWGSLLRTWALAAPLALLGRAWVGGEPRGAELLQFLLVGGAFSLLYLAAGRGVLSLILRRGSRGVPA